MSEFFLILGYAFLPVIGYWIGVVLAEQIDFTSKFVGIALHSAAGIAIALIAIELMPRALESLTVWVVVLMFLIGAFLSVVTAKCVTRFSSKQGHEKSTKAWMIYAAIGTDLAADAFMTGTGSAVAIELGFLLAASQTIANIPGGFVVAAKLQQRKVTRKSRLIAVGLMALFVLLITAVSYLFLKDGSAATQSAALAFIVGLLLLTTIEDMIPEGDAPRPSRWLSTAAFSLGFAGFAILSAQS